MSAYESVSRGSLKLKGVSDPAIKKKKKKKKKEKELKKMLEQQGQGSSSGSHDDMESQLPQRKKEHSWKSRLTKAELAHLKIKEKRQEEEILKKAEKTHKERIMDFNGRLDALTEHFDIPKVSWTK